MRSPDQVDAALDALCRQCAEVRTENGSLRARCHALEAQGGKLEARVRALELHILSIQPHNLPGALPGETAPMTEETKAAIDERGRSLPTSRRSVEPNGDCVALRGLVAEQPVGEHEAE
jgi:hypothetical protein